MHLIRVIGILIGVVIVTVLIHEVGWASIERSLGLLGWGYVIVILYPLSWMTLNTLGWRMALHAQYARLSLWLMMQIRTAGEAFNALLPSGYVGGEPLKAKLLSQSIPMPEAASSVFIAKAAQSIGLVVFVGLGLTVGGKPGSPSPLKRPSELLALVLLSLGIGIFTALLTRRSFSRIGKWLHGLTGHPWLQKQQVRLTALDDSIGAFYREGKRRFLSSVLWYGAGWIAGALEVAVIFYLIGHPVTLREAWFIGALAQLGSVVGLFAPAGVGLYEGGHYLAAQVLGLPPSLGVSVALIRRVRELFWNCTGLWLFWRLSKTTPVALTSTPPLAENDPETTHPAP